MANNRLYVINTETKEKLCIAKNFGEGWMPGNKKLFFEMLESIYENKGTALIFITENDEVGFEKYISNDEYENINSTGEWDDSDISCPICGAKEVDAMTPRTVYACGSSDYDQRPGTFKKGSDCQAIKKIDSSVSIFIDKPITGKSLYGCRVSFFEWIPKVCPGCRYSKLPLDIPAPCEECDIGDEYESGEPEPWMLADKKALWEKLQELEKIQYSIDKIKSAFFKTFHESGELWFNNLGTKEENNDSTMEFWGEFLDNLTSFNGGKNK